MMKPVLISLPPELEKGAKEKAATNYESLAAYVRRLIVADLKSGNLAPGAVR